MFFRLSFVLGSTSAMGSGPTFTLPVTAASSIVGLEYIPANFTDAGNNDYLSVATLDSTTVARWRVMSSTSGVITGGVIATSPFTWGTGDIIAAKGFYEAA